MPVNKVQAEAAMDHAACIGCGACVAACPNAAAQLFTGAKLAHLAQLPQGQVERHQRARAMVHAMEHEFGSCTNHGECAPACPADIELDVIALLNRDYARSMLRGPKRRRAPAEDRPDREDRVDRDDRDDRDDRRDIPWLSRLRSGPWLQSDPGPRPDATHRSGPSR